MPLDIADISASLAPGARVDIETERDALALIHKSARLMDDRQYLEWMELFAEDGEYSAITWENLNQLGLRLYRDVGKASIYERVAFLMGLWQTPRGKTIHFVSNTEVSAGQTPDLVKAVSNFMITRTAEFEHTELHAAGRYIDILERQDGVWRFKQRLSIVDSNLLPGEFTELL
jgi:3-phenylpropionate/cinnamic acid dioxygenase small subunit